MAEQELQLARPRTPIAAPSESPSCCACCASRRCAIRCCCSCSPRSGCSSISPPTALSSRQRNLVLLALQTSIVSLAAISAVMLIVTRNFDLSVGSAVALGRRHTRGADRQARCRPLLAVAVAIAGGLAMGAWQGLWVTRVGVSSFIVTLAGMLYFRGISMIATNGATVAPLPRSLDRLRHRLPAAGLSIAAIVLVLARLCRIEACRDSPGAGAGGHASSAAQDVVRALVAGDRRGMSPRSGSRRWQGIPYLVLLVAVCALAAEFVMRRTTLRRPALCDRRQSGGGAACRESTSTRVIFWNFVIAGLRLRHHRRRADRARQRRDRRQRRPVPRT